MLMLGLASRLARHPLVVAPDFRNFFLADVFVTVAERYFVLTFAWWLLAGGTAGAASSAGGAAEGGRLGILMVLESAPTLVLGLLLGPIIDRAPKKRSMLLSTLLQTLIVGAVAALLALGSLTFPVLCAAGFLLGCLLPAFEGSINAALPEVVSDDQLAAATAVQSSTLEFSNIIAAALSASVVAAFGFEAAVAVNAALYAAGALFVLRVELAGPKSVAPPAAYGDDLRAGLRYLITERGLAPFVAVYVTKLLFTVPLLVVIPMLVESTLKEGIGWVGILEVGFSVGSIATALVLSLRHSHTGLYRNYALGLALLGALMLALLRADHPSLMLPILVLMGGAVAVLLSLSHILFQDTVPDKYKGRFFGILETLAATVTPLGYAAVGLTSQSGGVIGVLGASGLCLLLLSGIVLVIPRIPWDDVPS